MRGGNNDTTKARLQRARSELGTVKAERDSLRQQLLDEGGLGGALRQHPQQGQQQQGVEWTSGNSSRGRGGGTVDNFAVGGSGFYNGGGGGGLNRQQGPYPMHQQVEQAQQGSEGTGGLLGNGRSIAAGPMPAMRQAQMHNQKPPVRG